MEKTKHSKWELARYLIDAKKCVDSIQYASENMQHLANLGMREQINEKRRQFYINCGVIIDKAYDKNQKKALKNNEPLIESILYERDKNQAHKDYDYQTKKHVSLLEMIEEMKQQLECVRTKCESVLPAVITLDYVTHDKVWFRIVNGITPEKEEEILASKHPLYKLNVPEGETILTREVFQDTEDYKRIRENGENNYAVEMKNGLNSFEGLQNRQDSIIKINLMYGLDAWVTLTKESVGKIKKLQELGVFDVYERFSIPEDMDEKTSKKLYEILKQGG